MPWAWGRDPGNRNQRGTQFCWCGLLLSGGSLPELRVGPSSETRDKLGQYGSGEGTLEIESGRGRVQGAGWSLTDSGWYGLLLSETSPPTLGTGPIRRTRDELGLCMPREGTP